MLFGLTGSSLLGWIKLLSSSENILRASCGVAGPAAAGVAGAIRAGTGVTGCTGTGTGTVTGAGVGTLGSADPIAGSAADDWAMAPVFLNLTCSVNALHAQQGSNRAEVVVCATAGISQQVPSLQCPVQSVYSAQSKPEHQW